MRSIIGLALGLLVPLALVLGSIVLIPASIGHFLGISLRSWCLFGCAPTTSVLLALCAHRLRVEERRR